MKKLPLAYNTITPGPNERGSSKLKQFYQEALGKLSTSRMESLHAWNCWVEMKGLSLKLDHSSTVTYVARVRFFRGGGAMSPKSYDYFVPERLPLRAGSLALVQVRGEYPLVLVEEVLWKDAMDHQATKQIQAVIVENE